jgi:hypothetical protein
MAYTTIKKPSDYFNTKLYTGTGSSQAITGVDFQPDMVWIKDRTGTGYHRINDAVRGATKEIYPNVTNAENTEPQAVTSFDTDGFTVGSNNGYSQNGYNFASWNWLGANGTAANTDGSITSTVSANTTSGFSVVSYTGTGANATVGHGLNSLCKWIIIKRLNGTNNWEIGNTAMGWDKHIYFTTTAQLTNSNRFQDTAPTNSVFYLGNGEGVNASGGNYIAYCFAEKQGYSKFGSYTGNGSTDGTFVYTGFKPAFVMVKNTNAVNHWSIYDNKRNGFNTENNYLRADGTYAEGSETWGDFDLFSNGFKPRATDAMINSSGNTFIYMAFASEPLVGDNPATAR